MGTTYKDSGVDIEAGDALVERIRPLAARTQRPEVLSGVGGFGGLFALPPGRWKEPVLVAGTDGVGTKLKVAFAAGQHNTVGIDLVAMSVNDVLACGRRATLLPRLLRDAASGRRAGRAGVAGIAEGCAQAGCTLLGGETAELPGFYATGEYDLAGFCVGVVGTHAHHQRPAPSARATPCWASPPPACTPTATRWRGGYCWTTPSFHWTAAWRACRARSARSCSNRPASTSRPSSPCLQAVDVRGLAHITGSGLPGNVPRCLPEGTRAVLHASAWPCPPIFSLIAQLGEVDRVEMFSTFNMGLGMVCVVPEASVDTALGVLRGSGVQAYAVGRVEAAAGEPTAVVLP